MGKRRRAVLSIWLAFELLLSLAGPTLAQVPIPPSEAAALGAPAGTPFACDTLWKAASRAPAPG
jgi:hypothetical protein